MANWIDFVKTAQPFGHLTPSHDERVADRQRSIWTALDYDKDGVPVFDTRHIQHGIDPNRSVMRPMDADGSKMPAREERLKKIQRNGNGNPDYMLGEMMNPILIAPQFSSGGVPRSWLSAAAKSIYSIGEEPAYALLRANMAELLGRKLERKTR